MKSLVALSFVLAALTGCAGNQPAIISDAHSDSVKIQENMMTGPGEVLKKGKEACALFGRTAVGPVSHQCKDEYCLAKVHLFICKPN